MTDSATDMHKSRGNNFGFMRLLFATLVIVSHSPEFLDGNRSREIMSRIFGTMSFGEVGVHGFFIISGYLITKSFVEGRSTISYLNRRFLRIVPGYLVCFLVCVLLVAPFVGGWQDLRSSATIRELFAAVVTLRPPNVANVFQGAPYQALNGPMWTIAYEFRCYLATILVGCLGLYHVRYRVMLLAATTVLLALDAAHVMNGIHTRFDTLSGWPQYTVEFSGVFGVGALYYLFRDKITISRSGAIVAGILLLVFLFSSLLAAAAFTVLGGYLIFWFAFEGRVLGLSRWTNTVDISYGLYLYACPIQQVIIWNDPSINPWLLCVLSILGAGTAGFASWTFVEKPMLRLAHRKTGGTPIVTREA